MNRPPSLSSPHGGKMSNGQKGVLSACNDSKTFNLFQKNILKFLFIIALLLPSYFLQAQNINPGTDTIYNNQEVAVIEITMNAADKTFLLANENAHSEEYLHASVRFKNSLVDSLLPDVGIRLRGNTSRNHPKKSFKIKFKEFDGSKFFGYK
ncbi:MAG: CotH kinase family protein, partial [Mariniphaga sp.]|nr:CotH kinase family protein [Mariniphaga sp.]